MSIVRHSVWAAAAAITLTAARFALTAIVARKLSQAGFGQFAYAQWLVDLAFLTCSLGATGVAGRYIAEYKTRPQELAALMARWRPFAYGLPVLSSGAVVIGAHLSGLHLGSAALSTLVLWTVTNGLWSMQTAALSGLQRFDLIFRANVLAAAIMLVGALVLPLQGSDIALLFALMVIASAAASTVGITATRRRAFIEARPLTMGAWRGIRGYALNIWITALLWSLVWSRGELPIVKAHLGDAGVAQYAAAMTLFGGAIQGVMLAVSGVAPHLTVLWGSGRRDEAIATARTLMDIQLLVCGAGALVLICIGPEMVTFAFGNAYREASAPLAIFAVGLLALGLSSQNHLLQVATDARFSRNTTMLGLAVLFGVAFILTPQFGLSGAASARAGTLLLLASISLIAVSRRWGRQAITYLNVEVVGAVIGVCAILVTVFSNSALLMRCALLVIAQALLACFMRNSQGQLLILVVPRYLSHRYRKGGQTS